MKRRQVCFWLAGACLCAAAIPARPDDAAAAVAAGGLVPRRETRIVMAKEVLMIRPGRVAVDYDFRNDSDEDVTTEVAFPVPRYQMGTREPPTQRSMFSSHFVLTIDGKRAAYKREAKAFVDQKDVTSILTADNIDVATFGHWNEMNMKQKAPPDFSRLPKAEQHRLVQLGLFEFDGLMWALWTVQLQYHWAQRFPAHSTVHIRHEYTPIAGRANFEFPESPAEMNGESLDAYISDLTDSARREHEAEDSPAARASSVAPDDHGSVCMDRPFLQTFTRSLQEAKSEARNPDELEKVVESAWPYWIDFILTSANTWKQPIEDFTLIVETPPDKNHETFASFCPPERAEVKRKDPLHLQVQLTNFVPTTELRVGFLGVFHPGRTK